MPMKTKGLFYPEQRPKLHCVRDAGQAKKSLISQESSSCTTVPRGKFKCVPEHRYKILHRGHQESSNCQNLEC